MYCFDYILKIAGINNERTYDDSHGCGFQNIKSCLDELIELVWEILDEQYKIGMNNEHQ